MAAIFIAEITIGVTGYMLKAESTDVLKKTLHDSMYYYNNETEYNHLWNELQGDLDCCGTNNYTDWIEIFKSESLPITCCTSALGEKGVMACSATTETLHKNSCFNALEKLIQENASSLGFTGIAIAVVQLLGIIFSCKLAYSIRSSYESV